MKQTGHLKPDESLSKPKLMEMLKRKFESINYDKAKSDVLPFIKEPRALDLWSFNFFDSITREKLIVIE